MDLTEPIGIRLGVRRGKPCFVVTRLAVYDVLSSMASGMMVEEIVGDFPELAEQHVCAGLDFAALRERRLELRREASVQLEPSRRLVGMFSIEYPESTHVTDVGRTAARRVRVVIRDVVRDPDARSGSDP